MAPAVSGEPRIDFVTGMARSGTTWLARALGTHPDVAVFGESSFFGRLYVPPRPDGLYGAAELERVRAIQRGQEWRATTGDASACLRSTPPERWPALVDGAFDGLAPPVAPAAAFQALAAAVARAEGASRVVEKTPHHVHWLHRLAVAFPDARFVLLIREPYGFMLSFGHLGDRIESRQQRALDRLWRHPLIAALAWRGYAGSIERARRRYPERTLFVDRQELRQRPAETLARVQAFLELEPHALASDDAGRNSSFPSGTRAGLREQDVSWMSLVAGRTMRRSGYRPEQVPLRPLPIALSFVTLLFSLAYAAVQLPRMVPGSFRDYLSGWLGR
jgi:hypothetical protein